MNTQYIVFKKQRDLGKVITDTFKFLKWNLKDIFKILLKTSLVPFVIFLFGVGLYTYATAGFGISSFGLEDTSIYLLLSAAIIMLLSLIYLLAVINGSITAFIRYYIQNEGEFKPKQVLDYCKANTGKFIGISLLQILIVGGVVFFIALIFGVIASRGPGNIFLVFLMLLAIVIPIAYLYTRFSLIYQAAVHRNNTPVQSFGTSSRFIHNNWWMTFATLLIIGIITGVISTIFQLPLIIYTLIKSFIFIQESSFSDPKSLVDPLLIFLQVFGSGIRYILYVIPAIASNFIFFHLNEKKYQTGTLERIDTIGE